MARPKGRPKTEAAGFVHMLIRIPPDLAEDLRLRATKGRRALNTQAIMWLEEARQHDLAEEHARRATPVGA